jgi:hypothetical protein
VNCLEFRRTLGADPNHMSPESSAHRAECPACEKYAQEMLRLNGLIKRALEIPVRSERKAPTVRTRWYAMAASVVLAIGLGGVFLFLSYSKPSLANDVAKHVEHEKFTLTPTETRISAELVNGALRAKGMLLTQPLENVSYAESCFLRGDLVPHFVVQTETGPVTVMIMPKETVKTATPFEEDGYRGILLPMRRGSMAVISSDLTTANSVADKVKSAIAWEGDRAK